MFLAEAKLNGASYSTIRAYFRLGSEKCVASALKRTALGFRWEPHKSGGSRGFVSEIYIVRLKKLVEERCYNLNALRTVEAMDFLVCSVQNMYSDAYKRLADWGCGKLAWGMQAPDVDFSNGYLTHFIERLGMFIKTPEVLEQLRRQYCNKPAIHQFFSKFQVFMANVSPHFVFNADETGLSTKRAYKVLTTNPRYRTTPAPGKEQHITAMCCFSAAGAQLPVMFIIAGLKQLPLDRFPYDEIYAVSKTGWMTAHLFNCWCVLFVCHVQRMRIFMNENEKKTPFVLFLDGHPSRFSPFGLRFMHMYNIIVIIFPSHSSHVFQPFDVSLASPLKVSYEKMLLHNSDEYEMGEGTQAMRARYARIRAFLDAWDRITPTECAKAFRSAGIMPWNEDAISMKHLITPEENALYNRERVSVLSGNEVTSDAFINTLQQHVRRLRFQDGVVYDITPNINATEAKIIWTERDYNEGYVLNDFCTFPFEAF